MAKKKKASAFRGKVSADVSRQEAAASSYGYLTLPKGVNVYSPTPGSKESFDVIPYEIPNNKHPDRNPDTGVAEKGDLWYKLPFKKHSNVGADNSSEVCLTSFGKKCPICDARKDMIKDGEDEAIIKEMKPSNRNLYYVVPRGIKKVEEEVHILDFSAWNFQKPLNADVKEKEEYEDFPAFEGGYTLKVRWDEEFFNKNSYAVATRIDFVERDEDIDEDILEDIPSLDTVLNVLSYEALYAKWHEIDEGEEEDEDEDENEEEDEKPKKRPAKKTPKKKVVEEDDDDDPALTWKDISDMDISELVDVIAEYALEVNADEYENVADLQEAIAEEMEIEVPKLPKKKAPAAKKKAPVKKVKAKECPEGGDFGKDHDELEACDGCPLWDACLDAN